MRVHIRRVFLFETQTSPLINVDKIVSKKKNVDKKLKILSITSKSKFIITNNYMLNFLFFGKNGRMIPSAHPHPISGLRNKISCKSREIN